MGSFSYGVVFFSTSKSTRKNSLTFKHLFVKLRSGHKGPCKFTYATCIKCVKYMKTCVQLKRMLDFTLPWSFKPIWWIFFGNIMKKKKKTIWKKPLSMHLRTCFGCHHRILKNNDFFLGRLREISLIWFSLVSVLTERCKHYFP